MSTSVHPNADAIDAEIRERIAASVAASVARREARRQQRAEHTERRTAGLRQRHARKLARQEPASVPRDPHRAAAPVAPPPLRNRGVPGPDERTRLRSTLGAALRRARVARRLSQRSLAALAGCDRRTVQRVEAGQLRPTTALVAALALALAVPPGYAPSGRREQVEVLRAELAAAAGPSLVPSTPGGERRRRRRLRKARLAAKRAALPMLRAQHRLLPQRTAAALTEAAAIVRAARSYR